ncbi:hypothetical protein RCL1_004511 [Eukaryota sp. TZLM3-RCL]
MSAHALPELDSFFPEGKNPFAPKTRSSLENAIESIESLPYGSSLGRKPRPKTAVSSTSRSSISRPSSSQTTSRIHTLRKKEAKSQDLINSISFSPSSLNTTSLLDQVRTHGRLNYLQKISNDDVTASLVALDKEKEVLIQSHGVQVAELKANRDELLERLRILESNQNEKSSELESLYYTTDLLRSKCRVMEEKLIEKDQKLKTYQSLEPVFKQLSESFSFNSPLELVEKFEFLERTQQESHDQLNSILDERNSFQSKFKTLLQENESLKQQLSNLATSKQSKLEFDLDVLKRQLISNEELLAKHHEETTRYRRISLSLQELYDKWVSDGTLSLDKPLDIIEAIDMLLVNRGVNDSDVKYLRQLSGLSNKIWREFFNENIEIKGQPLKIYSSVADLILKQRESMEKQTKIIRELKNDVKIKSEEVERLKRKVRVFESTVPRGRAPNVSNVRVKKPVQKKKKVLKRVDSFFITQDGEQS